jgi:hypothetical protein
LNNDNVKHAVGLPLATPGFNNVLVTTTRRAPKETAAGYAGQSNVHGTANVTPSAFVKVDYGYFKALQFNETKFYFCLSLNQISNFSLTYGSKGRDTVTFTIYSYKSIYG